MEKERKVIQFLFTSQNLFLMNEKDILTRIIYPIITFIKLKNAGYNEEIACAGLLLKAYNYISYDFNDISKLFGGRISSYIMSSLDPSKDLDSKEYEKQTLKSIKGLPDENKAIICTSKILEMQEIITDNLTSEEINTKRKYYQNIFDALNEDTSDYRMIGLLNNYYMTFTNAFYGSEIQIENLEIDNNTDPDSILINYELSLQNLKRIVTENEKEFIITFKNNLLTYPNNIIDSIISFIDSDFNIRTNNKSSNELRSLSETEKHLLIAASLKGNILEDIVGNKSIVMCSSTVYEILLFLKLLVDSNHLSKESLIKYLNNNLEDLERFINHTSICYVDIQRVINNDYAEFNINKENYKNLKSYNQTLLECSALLTGSDIIDVTKINNTELSMYLASSLLPIMKEDYMVKLKRYLEIKNVA